MGTDATTCLVKKNDDGKYYYLTDENYPKNLFSRRFYAIYAFIGDCRNYWGIPPISSNADGRFKLSDYEEHIQKNFFDEYGYGTYLEVDELINFNYDDEFEIVNFNSKKEEDESCYKDGEKVTYKKFLTMYTSEENIGYFFSELERLKDFMVNKDAKEFRLIMSFWS